MSYSPEIEANIAKNTAIREKGIAELKTLYARLCLLQGKEVSSAVFDDHINSKFETKYGVDSLTFESIQIVKEGLVRSIAKAEKKVKEKHFTAQE